MENLKEYISKKRPTLSKSSLTTYASILKNIYKRVFGDGELDFKKFDEVDDVMKYLKDIPANRRKTMLSALVIITDKKPYRDLMLEDVRTYNAEIHKQIKSETQQDNWVETDDVKKVFDELKSNADLLYKKKNLTQTDLQQIQSYILMALLGGMFIPPRRSKDYVDFSIKDIDKDTENYLDKNKMVFTSYKTAKTYGTQMVDVPPPLKKILTKWISVNPTKYLLFDTNMNKLSSVKLNQRLNKIFGEKKIGINALRHTYLTDKYGETIKTNNALANDMSQMGSSMGMANTYIKEN